MVLPPSTFVSQIVPSSQFKVKVTTPGARNRPLKINRFLGIPNLPWSAFSVMNGGIEPLCIGNNRKVVSLHKVNGMRCYNRDGNLQRKPLHNAPRSLALRKMDKISGRIFWPSIDHDVITSGQSQCLGIRPERDRFGPGRILLLFRLHADVPGHFAPEDTSKTMWQATFLPFTPPSHPTAHCSWKRHPPEIEAPNQPPATLLKVIKLSVLQLFEKELSEAQLDTCYGAAKL